MFQIDQKARDYILRHCSGAVTIVFDFHPMMGGG
jgi:hypothetical protein